MEGQIPSNLTAFILQMVKEILKDKVNFMILENTSNEQCQFSFRFNFNLSHKDQFSQQIMNDAQQLRNIPPLDLSFLREKVSENHYQWQKKEARTPVIRLSSRGSVILEPFDLSQIISMKEKKQSKPMPMPKKLTDELKIVTQFIISDALKEALNAECLDEVDFQIDDEESETLPLFSVSEQGENSSSSRPESIQENKIKVKAKQKQLVNSQLLKYINQKKADIILGQLLSSSNRVEQNIVGCPVVKTSKLKLIVDQDQVEENWLWMQKLRYEVICNRQITHHRKWDQNPYLSTAEQ